MWCCTLKRFVDDTIGSVCNINPFMNFLVRVVYTKSWQKLVANHFRISIDLLVSVCVLVYLSSIAFLSTIHYIFVALALIILCQNVLNNDGIAGSTNWVTDAEILTYIQMHWIFKKVSSPQIRSTIQTDDADAVVSNKIGANKQDIR